MSARPYRFARAARSPHAWGAFAIMTCLTAFAINTQLAWWLSATWASVGLITALHLLRNPVTRISLDETGLTARQGRHPARHFPRDQIVGLEHWTEPKGPGLLQVVLADGRREALTLLQLPRSADLARAAKRHGLPFAEI